MFQFQDAFPGYEVPAELLELINADHLADESDTEHVSPTFRVTEDGSVILFVEHQTPARRDPDNPFKKRFTVAMYDETGEYLGVGIETDSLDELLDYLGDHFDLWSIKAAEGRILKWVGRIGLGFHPDTRGKDYTDKNYKPVLPGATAREYDNDIAYAMTTAAVYKEFDPYEVALNEMTKAIPDAVI